MDINLITLSIALVALCLPWLYDGTLFTRSEPDRIPYRPAPRRVPLNKDEVRQRARRRL